MLAAAAGVTYSTVIMKPNPIDPPILEVLL